MECLDAADALQGVKGCGLWGLSSYEDPSVTRCLSAALESQDRRTHEMALSYLESRRDAGEMLEPMGRWMANGEDYRVTRAAADILGKEARRNPKALEILSESKAPYAVWGLGLSWSPKAFDLISARRNEGEPESRGLALRALGLLRDERSFDILIAGLKDPEERVRRGAVVGLGLLRDERAVPHLLALAADEKPGVRQRAVEALAELGGEKALDAAKKALGDEDQDVVLAGAEALRRLMPDARRVDLISERIKTAKPPLRVSLYRAVGYTSQPPRTVPVLLQGVEDEDPAVRAEVARELGWGGEERAIKPLIKLLDDKFAEVVNAAAEALRNYAPDCPEAAAALKNLGKKEATF
jgi:HEAT repeat protein